MPTGTLQKACWACRDKKVKCDKKLPTCSRCAVDGRPCERQGVRLSWPSENASRRAVLLAIDGRRGGHVSDHRPLNITSDMFVNVTSADMALIHGATDTITGKPHYYHVRDGSNSQLASESLKARGTSTQKTTTDKPHRFVSLTDYSRPSGWANARLKPPEQDLLAYFNQIVCNVTLSVDDSIGDYHTLLLTMSLGNDSISSTAVLQAMLALSALYLHGPAVGFVHKTRALTALHESSKRVLSYKEGLQHIAANMLLCLFEIHDGTRLASEWEAHACCAKTLVRILFDETQEHDGETALMFDWVYYHDALAKFSRLHLTTASAQQKLCRKKNPLIKSRNITSPSKQNIRGLLGCSLETMDSIVAVCDLMIPAPQSTLEPLESIAQRSLVLKLRLDNLRQVLDDGEFQGVERKEKIMQVAELYRLAGLVYLLCGPMEVPTSAAEVTEHVDQAFAILERLDTCKRAFPLFVLACQARCDQRRRTVLELIRRTQARHFSGSVACVRSLVEAMWAQDDLHPRVDINFVAKATAVISSFTFLPVFT